MLNTVPITNKLNVQSCCVESEYIYKVNSTNDVVHSSLEHGIHGIVIADKPLKNIDKPINAMRTDRNLICQIFDCPWLSHHPNSKVLVQPLINFLLPCISGHLVQ